MIMYMIFKRNELIWARNFRVKNETDAKERLEKTLEDIKQNKNIINIKFDGKSLEFLDIDEKHVMNIMY